MRKETELELAWLRRWSTTATMRARRSSGSGVGKTEKKEGRTATTSELYRAAKEARGRHVAAVSTPARSQGRPQARLERRRRNAGGVA